MLLTEVERRLILLEQGSVHGVDIGSYAVLFRACGKLRALVQGRSAHRHCIRSGHDRVRFLANLLVDMYGRCRAIEDSRQAFHSIADPDVFSWTIVISAHAQNGHHMDAIHLFRAMHLDGTKGDAFTFTIILGVCSSLAIFEEVRKIHVCVQECGFQSDVVVATALINLYGKCGDVHAAECAFDGIPHEQRDLQCWSSMVAAYAQNGHCTEAFRLFREMGIEGIEPNEATFVNVLGACCSYVQGKLLEERVVACGYASHVVLQTALVTMFGRLGKLDDSRRVFDRLQCKNTVSWSAMLAAYAQNGQTADAIQLFREMDLWGMKPDAVTYINLLTACPGLSEIRRIHSRVISEGHGSHILLGNSLVTLYGKVGNLDDSRTTFDMLPRKITSTWNALMAAYLHQEQNKEVLLLYGLMESQNMELDRVSIMCILSACSCLGDLHSGLQAYSRHVTVADSTLKTSLMNLYGKCGRVDEARDLFDETRGRDVVAWNAMIAAYAQHGHEQKAVDLFGEMLLDGICPNQSTFSNVLCATIHCGRRLHEAISYFGNVGWDFGISPEVEHYSSMVDVLGRAGWLQEAEEVLLNMPYLPTESTCLCLLSACRLHGNFERAARLSRGEFFVPGTSAHYVMLSNIFSEACKQRA